MKITKDQGKIQMYLPNKSKGIFNCTESSFRRYSTYYNTDPNSFAASQSNSLQSFEINGSGTPVNYNDTLYSNYNPTQNELTGIKLKLNILNNNYNPQLTARSKFSSRFGNKSIYDAMHHQYATTTTPDSTHGNAFKETSYIFKHNKVLQAPRLKKPNNQIKREFINIGNLGMSSKDTFTSLVSLGNTVRDGKFFNSRITIELNNILYAKEKNRTIETMDSSAGVGNQCIDKFIGCLKLGHDKSVMTNTASRIYQLMKNANKYKKETITKELNCIITDNGYFDRVINNVFRRIDFYTGDNSFITEDNVLNMLQDEFRELEVNTDRYMELHCKLKNFCNVLLNKNSITMLPLINSTRQLNKWDIEQIKKFLLEKEREELEKKRKKILQTEIDNNRNNLYDKRRNYVVPFAKKGDRERNGTENLDLPDISDKDLDMFGGKRGGGIWDIYNKQHNKGKVDTTLHRFDADSIKRKSSDKPYEENINKTNSKEPESNEVESPNSSPRKKMSLYKGRKKKNKPGEEHSSSIIEDEDNEGDEISVGGTIHPRKRKNPNGDFGEFKDTLTEQINNGEEKKEENKKEESKGGMGDVLGFLGTFGGGDGVKKISFLAPPSYAKKQQGKKKKKIPEKSEEGEKEGENTDGKEGSKEKSKGKGKGKGKSKGKGKGKGKKYKILRKDNNNQGNEKDDDTIDEDFENKKEEGDNIEKEARRTKTNSKSKLKQKSNKSFGNSGNLSNKGKSQYSHGGQSSSGNLSYKNSPDRSPYRSPRRRKQKAKESLTLNLRKLNMRLNTLTGTQSGFKIYKKNYDRLNEGEPDVNAMMHRHSKSEVATTERKTNKLTNALEHPSGLHSKKNSAYTSPNESPTRSKGRKKGGNTKDSKQSKKKSNSKGKSPNKKGKKDEEKKEDENKLNEIKEQAQEEDPNQPTDRNTNTNLNEQQGEQGDENKTDGNNEQGKTDNNANNANQNKNAQQKKKQNEPLPPPKHLNMGNEDEEEEFDEEGMDIDGEYYDGIGAMDLSMPGAPRPTKTLKKGRNKKRAIFNMMKMADLMKKDRNILALGGIQGEKNEQIFNDMDFQAKVKELQFMKEIKYAMMNESNEENKARYMEMLSQINNLKSYDIGSYMETLANQYLPFQEEIDSMIKSRKIEERLNRFLDSFHVGRKRDISKRKFLSDKIIIKDNKFTTTLSKNFINFNS